MIETLTLIKNILMNLQIEKAIHLLLIGELGLRGKIEAKRQRLVLILPLNLSKGKTQIGKEP